MLWRIDRSFLKLAVHFPRCSQKSSTSTRHIPAIVVWRLGPRHADLGSLAEGASICSLPTFDQSRSSCSTSFIASSSRIRQLSPCVTQACTTPVLQDDRSAQGVRRGRLRRNLLRLHHVLAGNGQGQVSLPQVRRHPPCTPVTLSDTTPVASSSAPSSSPAMSGPPSPSTSPSTPASFSSHPPP